ncbi:MAG: hypothetical protein ACXADY_23540 [Candidatus Hodarchaeales archaeon]
MQKIKSFKLIVNDEKIAAKRFIREFIGNSLLGMVETLHLRDPTVRKINLMIEFREREK